MQNIKMNWWLPFITICMGIIGLLFGSFFDLKISQTVYNSASNYGLFFATFGVFFESFLIDAVAVIWFKSLRGDELLIKIGKIFGIFFFLAASTYLLYGYISSTFNGFVHLSWVKNWMIIVITISLELLSLVLLYLFINIDNIKLAFKISLVIIAVIALELAIVNVVKIFWARPRFRMIYDGFNDGNIIYSVEELFRNWYQIGSGIAKDVFLNDPSDNFKSFPSGHTSGATTALLLFYLPSLNKRTSTKKIFNYIFYGVGVLWIILVASSRIVFGAHFLSDVSAGCIITSCIILITNIIYQKINNKKIVKEI